MNLTSQTTEPRLTSIVSTLIPMLAIALSVIVAYRFFTPLLRRWAEAAYQLAGPAILPLTAIAAYLIGYLYRLTRRLREPLTSMDCASLLSQLEFAEDLADKASIIGLLGTIAAMLTSSNQGSPGIDEFLLALGSTMVGSSIFMIATAYVSALRLRVHQRCVSLSGGRG